MVTTMFLIFSVVAVLGCKLIDVYYGVKSDMKSILSDMVTATIMLFTSLVLTIVAAVVTIAAVAIVVMFPQFFLFVFLFIMLYGVCHIV